MNGPAHPGNSWTLLDAAPSVGQRGGQRPGKTALVSGMESHEAPTACLPFSSSRSVSQALLCLPAHSRAGLSFSA